MAAARRKSVSKVKPSPAAKAKPAQPEKERRNPSQLERERLAMIECAVKALIVAHPNRGDLRAIFDVLYSEHRVSQKQSPEPTEPALLEMLAALFQTDAESETASDSL